MENKYPFPFNTEYTTLLKVITPGTVFHLIFKYWIIFYK